MAYNNDFSWNEEIYCMDPMGFYSDRYVETDKLIRTIEKYGVDTIDKHRQRLIVDHVKKLTDDQLDILLGYKPKLTFVVFFNEERVFWFGDFIHKETYILKKVLESDTEYAYNTHPFYFMYQRYKNLLEYITFILDDEKNQISSPDHKLIICEQHLLLKNHMNKWISLFDMMKPHLEKSDKKRRIH